MKMLDRKAVLKYLNAPSGEELAKWCEENNYSGMNLMDDTNEDASSDYVLAAGLWYAKTNYPDAPNIDVCSYAGLVGYLATGWYVWIGTDFYEKERQAENIIVALAGGTTFSPEGEMFLVPEKAMHPSIEFTEKVLPFLEMFYFKDEEQAVIDLLNMTDERTAANIILSLAKTNVEYQELAQVADLFLKKKSNIASLRRAVRKALEREK